jgi:hypothetical protein
VVAYCGALSSHDQYFFRNKQEMVAGAVRAPRLDLTNEALVRAHVQAEWLAQVGLPMRQSVEEVVDTDKYPDLPLRESAAVQIRLGQESLGRLRARIERILQFDRAVLERAGGSAHSGSIGCWRKLPRSLTGSSIAGGSCSAWPRRNWGGRSS